MLTPLRVAFRQAREARGPAISKWEDLERGSLPLLLVSSLALAFIAFSGRLELSVAVLGGGVGLLIVAAYAAVFTDMRALAAALVGGLTAASHANLPLWLLTGNGLGGLVWVIALAALCTRSLCS